MAEPRPAPFFVGEHLALDLLNTVASPWGRKIEWLANGRDLVGWLGQAGAAPADALARIAITETPRALDKAASDVRKFRESFRRFVRRHAGKPLAHLSVRELEALNGLLAHDEAYWQIAAATAGKVPEPGHSVHGPFHWRAERRWKNATSLFFLIVAAMGDLIIQTDFTHVRKCEGAGCSLWFLDVSKNHARRWCSMAVCGNRAKVEAFRARARRKPTGRSREE